MTRMPRLFRPLVASLALATAALGVARSALAEFVPLKDGDRVVFYGDSITEQRLYTRYLQQYVDVRYPGRSVRFFNAGWGGDTSPGAARRFERDVLSLKPDVITFFFGMNDGHYKRFETATADEYRAGMERMLQACKERGIRAIVYTPGVVDYDKNERLKDEGYNETLKQLGDVCRELGEKYGAEVVDVHGAMLTFQSEQKARDPKWTMIPDSVHPNDAGHLMMASAMLPALAEPMGTIAAVDAASPGDGAQRDGDVLTIRAEAGAPFWIDGGSLDVAKRAGVDDYVRPKLTVKNLPAGTYWVGVEGGPAQTASADELAKGLPLAIDSAAGKAVHDLVRKKEDLYFTAWRELRLPLGELEKVDDALFALGEADAALSQAIAVAASKKQVLTLVVQPAPAGPNLALGKPYETSDPNKYGWGIGKLTDGSWVADGLHCFATGDVDAFPKTVTVDLQSSSPLDLVAFGVPDFGSTRTVIASISEDGKTFQEVGRHEFAQRKAARAVLKFPTASARYVRLTYPDHYAEEAGHGPFYSFTTELEAYGPQKK